MYLCRLCSHTYVTPVVSSYGSPTVLLYHEFRCRGTGHARLLIGESHGYAQGAAG